VIHLLDRFPPAARRFGFIPLVSFLTRIPPASVLLVFTFFRPSPPPVCVVMPYYGRIILSRHTCWDLEFAQVVDLSFSVVLSFSSEPQLRAHRHALFFQHDGLRSLLSQRFFLRACPLLTPLKKVSSFGCGPRRNLARIFVVMIEMDLTPGDFFFDSFSRTAFLRLELRLSLLFFISFFFFLTSPVLRSLRGSSSMDASSFRIDSVPPFHLRSSCPH